MTKMVMTILKETEALRGKVTCPRSLSQEMTELGLEPGSSELPSGTSAPEATAAFDVRRPGDLSL